MPFTQNHDMCPYLSPPMFTGFDKPLPGETESKNQSPYFCLLKKCKIKFYENCTEWTSKVTVLVSFPLLVVFWYSHYNWDAWKIFSIHLPTHPPIHPLIHPTIHSSTQLLIYPLIHPTIPPRDNPATHPSTHPPEVLLWICHPNLITLIRF